VLTAWAEAMAWSTNTNAPDDQVLDKLLKEGGWLARASFGWLASPNPSPDPSPSPNPNPNSNPQP
jgi:hypothetical protein